MDVSYISGFPKKQNYSIKHLLRIMFYNVLQEHEHDINQLHASVFKTRLSGSELHSLIHFLKFLLELEYLQMCT